MHKVSFWLVGRLFFFISHHLFSLIASLYSYTNMRKNLDLMHILTLPFPTHAKTLHPKNLTGNMHSNQVSGKCEKLKATRGDQKLWHGQVSFVGSLSWALLETFREVLSSYFFFENWVRMKKRLRWKGRCKFCHWSFMPGEIAVHFIIEQSVSSSLPTLRKRKVGEKNTSEKPNGCGGSQVIQWKREK